MDFQELAKKFAPGDIVQRMIPGDDARLSPYVGEVVEVHYGLGQVDVKWSYGDTDRVSPEELVKSSRKMAVWFPPELDAPNSDAVRKRRASVSEHKLWGGASLPAGFYKRLARLWNAGHGEVSAYDNLWVRFASEGISDDRLRSETQKFYRVSTRLMDMRIQNAAKKNAAYWAARDRQYRVSKREMQAGKPSCPKCGTMMKRTTYKMAEGDCVRLFACPTDLTLIKSDALLGPHGEPIGW